MRCCNFNLTGLSYRCLPNGLGEMGSADVSMHFDEQHWSPAYWERHHRALLDVCEQIGAPHLFVTVARCEWLFPFPFWNMGGPALLPVLVLQSSVEQKPWQSPMGCIEYALAFSVGHRVMPIGGRTMCREAKVGAFGGAQAHFARYEYQAGGK